MYKYSCLSTACVLRPWGWCPCSPVGPYPGREVSYPKTAHPQKGLQLQGYKSEPADICPFSRHFGVLALTLKRPSSCLGCSTPRTRMTCPPQRRAHRRSYLDNRVIVEGRPHNSCFLFLFEALLPDQGTVIAISGLWGWEESQLLAVSDSAGKAGAVWPRYLEPPMYLY